MNHIYLRYVDNCSVKVKCFLTQKYGKERSKLINFSKATINPSKGSPLKSSDTVQFCAVDKWGNACSFINSNAWNFGTGWSFRLGEFG